jgi:sulfate-transporting ATPase
MLLLVIGVATMLVLWALYRYTRFGRITSAVAENQHAAATLGHSPDVIATGNWALGGALAALAGCLIAPITFLQPTSLSLLIVPALAAGLIAGFSSFPIALAGALVIGVAESLMGRYVQEPGWGASVPFIAVIVVLVVRGRGLPLRSHVLDRLPAVGSGNVRPVPTLILFLVMALLLVQLFPVRWVDAFSVTMIFVILCMSVVVVTGLAGQLSLCQYVLAGVGALTAARLSASWGWSFPLAVGGAMAVTMALGAVVALPALRTRGLNLAIVTFGMATVIYALVLNNSEYTGGDTGIRVKPPTFFGWSINPIRHPERYAFITLSTLFLAALMLCNIRRGAVGRRLIAVRSNERAAAAAGVNVYSAKVYAFVVASALASVAGVLSSFRNTNVLAGSFSVFPSINIVGMTVVGGVGSVGGAVFGATLLQGGVGSELLRNFHGIEKYLPLAGGLILLHILRTDQNGLFSMNVHLAKQVSKPFVALYHKARRGIVASDAESEPTLEVDSTIPEMVTPKVLRVEGLTIAFGGVVAVNNVSIEVRPGEVHGLIGPNGAGKTTVVDGITGFVSPRSGRITLDGVEINRWSPRRRARVGVSRSFQSLELFNDLSVAENMAVACDRGHWTKFLTDIVRPGRVKLSSTAIAALREFELEADANAKPDSLPFGRRRMVAIARAVAAGPSVILLDEPASGLGDVESEELARFIRSLAKTRGMGILLIEHNIDLVLSVCDRVTVMATGSVLTAGTPEEVRVDPEVLTAYIGEDDQPNDVADDAVLASVIS